MVSPSQSPSRSSRQGQTSEAGSHCSCSCLLLLLRVLQSADISFTRPPSSTPLLLLSWLRWRTEFSKRGPHLLLPPVTLNCQRHLRARRGVRHRIAENVGLGYSNTIEGRDDVALLHARSLSCAPLLHLDHLNAFPFLDP